MLHKTKDQDEVSCGRVGRWVVEFGQIQICLSCKEIQAHHWAHDRQPDVFVFSWDLSRIKRPQSLLFDGTPRQRSSRIFSIRPENSHHPESSRNNVLLHAIPPSSLPPPPPPTRPLNNHPPHPPRLRRPSLRQVLLHLHHLLRQRPKIPLLPLRPGRKGRHLLQPRRHLSEREMLSARTVEYWRDVLSGE